MLIANFALTFVQTVGAFAEPGLLGGPRGQMLGNVIAEQLNSGSGRQFAVALALVLLVASLLVVALFAGIVMWLRTLQSGVGARPTLRSPRVPNTVKMKGQLSA
jgi:ABC-type spermidine/putrescine transport system permease subunit I